MVNNQKTLIWVLSSVILVLVLVGLYFFVVRPEMVSYDNNRRVEGVNYAFASILQGIQTQGFTQLPVSENQSVILAYVTPEELKFLQQIRQQAAAQNQQQNPEQSQPSA